MKMTEQQIKDEFIGLTNLEEVKKVFKRLAKLLHPDVSKRDSEEEFKILNSIYNSILDFLQN
jgi:DnaJ-class molecular chaperone